MCGGRRDFWGVQGEGLGCQLNDTLLSATIKEALAQMTNAYAQFSYTHSVVSQPSNSMSFILRINPNTGKLEYIYSDPQDPPAALRFANTAVSAEGNEPDALQPSNESADADAIFAPLDHALATDTKEVMNKLLGIPIEMGFEMDRRLKADSNLLVEFNENPNKVLLEEVGLELPEGFYCYFADENNVVSPPQGDVCSLKSWSRIEIRTSSGQGAGSFLFCITCGILE